MHAWPNNRKSITFKSVKANKKRKSIYVLREEKEREKKIMS